MSSKVLVLFSSMFFLRMSRQLIYKKKKIPSIGREGQYLGKFPWLLKAKNPQHIFHMQHYK